MIWVIMSDATTCKIYEFNQPDHLSLIKEIYHPENKLRDIELTADKPGHYKTSGGARGAYTQSSDPKAIKVDEFSREIAKELDHGRNNHAYKKLIIISPPHTSGLLFQHLNKHVKDLVINNIHKDLLHLSDHELLSFLQTHAKYSDQK